MSKNKKKQPKKDPGKIKKNVSMAVQHGQPSAFYPFPTPEEVQRLKETIKLGSLTESIGQASLFIPVDSMTRHVMVSGKTGTGKIWFQIISRAVLH